MRGVAALAFVDTRILGVDNEAMDTPNTNPVAEEPMTSDTDNMGQNPSTNSQDSVVAESPKANTAAMSNSTPKKGVKFVVLGVALVVVALYALSATVAYGVVKVKNASLRETAQKVTFALPIMPKTPGYVLMLSQEASKDLKSAHIDASVAYSSPEITTMLTLMGMPGAKSLEARVVGPIEMSDDPSQPNLSWNISMGSFDANADFIMHSGDVYLKLNKIPPLLTAMMAGMSQGDSEDAQTMQLLSSMIQGLTNKWIYLPSNSLDSAAGQKMVETKAADMKKFQEEAEELFNELYYELNDTAEMTDAELNGNNVYKITFVVPMDDPRIMDLMVRMATMGGSNAQMAEESFKEALSGVKDVTIVLYIDKSNYLTHRTEVSMKMEYSVANEDPISGRRGTTPTAKSVMDIAVVVDVTEHNEPVTITLPTDYLNLEQLMTQMIGSMMGGESMMQGSEVPVGTMNPYLLGQ